MICDFCGKELYDRKVAYKSKVRKDYIAVRLCKECIRKEKEHIKGADK